MSSNVRKLLKLILSEMGKLNRDEQNELAAYILDAICNTVQSATYGGRK